MTTPGVGTNRYAYAANDPVNISDPSGHRNNDQDYGPGVTTSNNYMQSNASSSSSSSTYRYAWSNPFGTYVIEKYNFTSETTSNTANVLYRGPGTLAGTGSGSVSDNRVPNIFTQGKTKLVGQGWCCALTAKGAAKRLNAAINALYAKFQREYFAAIYQRFPKALYGYGDIYTSNLIDKVQKGATGAAFISAEKFGRVVGVYHNHPSSDTDPSRADQNLFDFRAAKYQAQYGDKDYDFFGYIGNTNGQINAVKGNIKSDGYSPI